MWNIDLSNNLSEENLRDIIDTMYCMWCHREGRHISVSESYCTKSFFLTIRSETTNLKKTYMIFANL